ncbi:hypothetical protein FWK35_00036025 [Aphis craccivora]|uniref:Uncharacterized protein n=1 Tax=Aphis craccivora TaxID=307492 RepID=A0A6G0VIZ5_APHCR|nr:hypothetical protein FWK35_00036025 [Aphis craccivora]
MLFDWKVNLVGTFGR